MSRRGLLCCLISAFFVVFFIRPVESATGQQQEVQQGDVDTTTTTSAARKSEEVNNYRYIFPGFKAKFCKAHLENGGVEDCHEGTVFIDTGVNQDCVSEEFAEKIKEWERTGFDIFPANCDLGTARQEERFVRIPADGSPILSIYPVLSKKSRFPFLFLKTPQKYEDSMAEVVSGLRTVELSDWELMVTPVDLAIGADTYFKLQLHLEGLVEQRPPPSKLRLFPVAAYRSEQLGIWLFSGAFNLIPATSDGYYESAIKLLKSATQYFSPAQSQLQTAEQNTHDGADTDNHHGSCPNVPQLQFLPLTPHDMAPFEVMRAAPRTYPFASIITNVAKFLPSLLPTLPQVWQWNSAFIHERKPRNMFNSTYLRRVFSKSPEEMRTAGRHHYTVQLDPVLYVTLCPTHPDRSGNTVCLDNFPVLVDSGASASNLPLRTKQFLDAEPVGKAERKTISYSSGEIYEMLVQQVRLKMGPHVLEIDSYESQTRICGPADSTITEGTPAEEAINEELAKSGKSKPKYILFKDAIRTIYPHNNINFNGLGHGPRNKWLEEKEDVEGYMRSSARDLFYHGYHQIHEEHYAMFGVDALRQLSLQQVAEPKRHPKYNFVIVPYRFASQEDDEEEKKYHDIYPDDLPRDTFKYLQTKRRLLSAIMVAGEAHILLEEAAEIRNMLGLV